MIYIYGSDDANPNSAMLGITQLEKIAENLEYEVKEVDITVEMLYNADEAFFTGTATEVVPICEVDGRKIGDGKPGPITLKLQKEYLDIVKGKKTEYEAWLTYI